jgi:hypothetical protein
MVRQRQSMTTAEGTVPFRGYRTWYQVVGGIPRPVGRCPCSSCTADRGFLTTTSAT